VPARLAALNHPAALFGALLVAVFAVALLAGYVYAHEPARDELVLQLDQEPPPTNTRALSGVIVEVLDDRLMLQYDGGQLEVMLSGAVPIEELRRDQATLAPGTPVNLGAEETSFGLVLTGIVAVEEPAP
jgi:hypothetical protein